MKTSVICITGFLGAGKTTFLNKILPSAMQEGKVAIIENDFGDTGIDGDFLSKTEVPIWELSSGCICCSLKGEMKSALKGLIENEKPKIIFIEPSGVSRSAEILTLLAELESEALIELKNIVTLVDVANFDDYISAFGNFYCDQIVNGRSIFFSHQDEISVNNIKDISTYVQNINQDATLFTSNWLLLKGEDLWELLCGELINTTQFFQNIPEKKYTEFRKDQSDRTLVAHNVFSSWNKEITRVYEKSELESCFIKLASGEGGQILRAKGYCSNGSGQVWHFNYLNGHSQLELLDANFKTSAVVIGQDLEEKILTQWFQ